jgi:hypothetical protein
MKIVRCAFVGIMFLGLAGCGLLFGYHEETGPDGKPKIVVTGDGIADKATGLLGLLGPWGIAAAAALGIVGKVVRHREIIAKGQKDDDLDGIPDDQQKPPTVG